MVHRSRSLLTGVRKDRLILGVFIVLFLLSGFVLLRKFYTENTELRPSKGGTYIEGSVGELQPLNPWFIVTNDVNRDILSLVFAGLLKYNPETKQIEESLATLEESPDGTIYTVTLKDNLYWHDSTVEDIHRVTADDILFTYKTLQDVNFPNSLLRQNFQGVEVEKLSDTKVRFKLEEPYHFFPSNLTIGLLPARSFEAIPVDRLDQTIDFGFNPIGAGPYAFKGLVQTELSTEVTLERFSGAMGDPYHLERVIFRIYPDYPTLLSDIRTLDGVRHVPRSDNGDPIVPRQFSATNYTLPQYIALFFNLEQPKLRDQKLRLGLQLGTDKQDIVNRIGEGLIVDTPLLEIDVSDWRYKFDPDASQGALFSTNWHLPEKVRLQRLLEIREANEAGPLRLTPIALLDTGAVLTVTGSLSVVSLSGSLNTIPLSPHPTNTGAWIVGLPTTGGSGSLVEGYSLLQLADAKGKILDSYYLWRTTKSADFRRAVEEQRLVDLFIASRDAEFPEENKITVQNLYLEQGMLRRRLSTDPTDIRINDAGERLSLRLLTSSTPPEYPLIAKGIQAQWAKLGVEVTLQIPTSKQEFEEKMLTRDYDILLFGQSLLDNLDSYPYWHSSGVQKLNGQRRDLRIDAYNMSQYSSLEADSLLEVIRETQDDEERSLALQELREVLKNDVPAIFLYSPLYTYAHNKDLKGIELNDLSMHSDRFLTLQNWYMKQERIFAPGKTWLSFFSWILGFLS